MAPQVQPGGGCGGVEEVRWEPRLIQVEQTYTDQQALHLGALVLTLEETRPLPLKKVVVRACVTGATCVTNVTQVFKNDLDVHMAATHLFPLPVDAAVTHMTLKAGDLVVQSETRPKQEAKKEYQEAERKGHRAALLSHEEGSNVHRLEVTNLPPKCDVEVRFSFVQILNCVDGGLRWLFPTVVAPRYAPRLTGQGADSPEHGVDDGEGVQRRPKQTAMTAAGEAVWPQPPLRLSGGTELDLEVMVQGNVRTLASSQHAVKMDLEDGGIRVRPSGIATLNKDFILSFSTAASKAISTQAYCNGEYTAVFVQPPANLIESTKMRLRRQAVFIIDISGSMSGSKMETSKRALISALHALQPGDEFKLVAFDDRLETFERGCLIEYTDANVNQADAWIQNLKARGGTEMRPALEEGFKTFKTTPLRNQSKAGPAYRSLLFITDGQSWDENRIVSSVASLRDKCRDPDGTPPTLFTLGIDTAVNESLLTRLARIGGGVCELATPSDDIEAVIMRLETDFGGSVLQNVGVVYDQGSLGSPFSPLPGTSPSLFVSLNSMELFTGRPLVVLFKGSASNMRIQGTNKDGSVVELSCGRKDVSKAVYEEQQDGRGDVGLLDHAFADFGALYAKQRIKYLEDVIAVQPDLSKTAKKEIEKLGLEFSLVTSETSKVAVEKSTVVRDGDASLVHVTQPSELPESWDKSFLCNAAMPPAPLGMCSFGGAGVAMCSAAPAAAQMNMSMDECAAPPMKACKGSGRSRAMMKKKSIDAMPKGASRGGGPGGLLQGLVASVSSFAASRRFCDVRQDDFDMCESLADGGAAAAEPVPEDMCESSNDEGGLFSDSPEVEEEKAKAPVKERLKCTKAPAPVSRSAGDVASEIARLQKVNGSFDEDVVETCLAILALIILGHTCSSGVRQRTVLKAVSWLNTAKRDQLIQAVLDALDKVEAGEMSADECVPLVEITLHQHPKRDSKCTKLLGDAWTAVVGTA